MNRNHKDRTYTMGLITRLAISRRSVTVLALILVLAWGLFTYRTLPVELFPEIEFPLVTITTFYPSANPEAVVVGVTEPVEKAIIGIDGLESIQSISSENRSVVLTSFEFGTDMAEVENIINSSLNGIQFPEVANGPIVGRINPDSFPVLQLSITGDRELIELQRILESRIIPVISSVDGVFRVEVNGEVQEQVTVTVDPDKLSENALSLFQISQVLSENSVTLPGGSITSDGQVLPIKTINTYESLDELKSLVVSSLMAFRGPPSYRCDASRSRDHG